jgi:hypothetical protein
MGQLLDLCFSWVIGVYHVSQLVLVSVHESSIKHIGACGPTELWYSRPQTHVCLCVDGNSEELENWLFTQKFTSLRSSTQS